MKRIIIVVIAAMFVSGLEASPLVKDVSSTVSGKKGDNQVESYPFKMGDVLVQDAFGTIYSKGDQKADEVLLKRTEGERRTAALSVFALKGNYSADDLIRAYDAVGVSARENLRQELASIDQSLPDEAKEHAVASYQGAFNNQVARNAMAMNLLLDRFFERQESEAAEAAEVARISAEAVREQQKMAARNKEASRLLDELSRQAQDAGKINFDELKAINFRNVFLSKVLALAPQSEAEVFKDFVIKTPVFLNPPLLDNSQLGFSIMGVADYAGRELKTFVTVVHNADLGGNKRGWGVSVGFEMPATWRISEKYPKFAKLDELSILSPRLVFSNFTYKDNTLGFIAPGLNFVSQINLSGPMEKFKTLLGEMKSYVIAEGSVMQLSGVINPVDITESSFTVHIPLYLGVDFEQLYQLGKLRQKPAIFRSVMTDVMTVKIKPATLAMDIQSGIVLGLMTQSDPLRLRAGVGVSGTAWRFFAELKGIYKNAFGQKWLSLGDMVFEVGVDPAVTAAFAAIGVVMPINSLGVQGTFLFGKDRVNANKLSDEEKKIVTTIAGKLQVNAPKTSGADVIPTFILRGSLNKANISDAINLLTRMVGKEVKMKNLPQIEFNNLLLDIAPMGGSIGSTYYPQGVAVRAGMMINSLKGELSFSVSNESKSIEGSGFISAIKTSIFSLKGTGEEVDPRFHLKISPLSYEALLNAELSIPFLGMNKALNFNLDGDGLLVKTREYAKFFGAETELEIRIPTDVKNLKDFLVQYEVNQNLRATIKEKVVGKLKAYRSKHSNILTKYLAKALEKVVDVATAFEVTKIGGRISGAEIAAGKTPSATIEFTLDVLGIKKQLSLTDVHIDFSKLGDLVEKMFDKVKNAL